MKDIVVVFSYPKGHIGEFWISRSRKRLADGEVVKFPVSRGRPYMAGRCLAITNGPGTWLLKVQLSRLGCLDVFRKGCIRLGEKTVYIYHDRECSCNCDVVIYNAQDFPQF